MAPPVRPVVAVKARSAIRASAGVAACVIGFILARASLYREATIRVDANGCQLVTDVIDKGNDQVAGSVVLIHGIAANKKIMGYLADAFAEQGLRVFVPDLPGHGRTPGPFSFARAESCAESLVQQLAVRGMIDSKRTLLAGHSMGAAIAVRVAARVDMAGVIAVSPAPMRGGRGIPADVLPYQNAPPLRDNTLVIIAAFEPFGIRSGAQSLVAANSATSKYLLIPHATHVSVLFDPRVARASEDWAAHVLGLRPDAPLPSPRPLVGSLLGLAGLLLLAGPFIRETLGARHAGSEELRQDTSGVAIDLGATDPSSGERAQAEVPVLPGAEKSSLLRAFVQIALGSSFAVIVLRFWNPFSFLHLFNGGYFAGFLFFTGLAILATNSKSPREVTNWRYMPRDGITAHKPPRHIAGIVRVLLGAGFAAIALHLLMMGWLDATLSEAWVSASRWARFPVLFVAALAYLLAEELLLRGKTRLSKFGAIALPLAMRLLAWLALVLAIFVLHSGAILLILLAPYIFLFFVLQSAGANVVRRQTESPLAATLFGAILLAAFCLVIFPVT